jgi:hypothetical protein
MGAIFPIFGTSGSPAADQPPAGHNASKAVNVANDPGAVSEEIICS